jgi:hypothetical protein
MFAGLPEHKPSRRKRFKVYVAFTDDYQQATSRGRLA